ncbi:MAG: PIG-L family deacetylase [Saprospiraceae bacterium]|nr:PIG-L family deacetylase [Saprospiraceae bacterium]
MRHLTETKWLSVITAILIWLTVSGKMMAQQPLKPTSGEIYKSIERLNFLGNALYVAAHPDDENTRLISYLVNEVNAHTTYLSLTRGDGGQNLIGPEIEELLGVIRTQELLQARKVDGGHQMFSRANDFGFSKNAEETISIWDNEQVKHDVVWAIRKTRPDVIINRFDHRTSGSTHGHHTASAMLSFELYEKAASAEAYKNQLTYVAPWQASRLFFNISWFFFGSQEAFNKADKSHLLSLDVGGFYPLLGKSNTEIAALSRSNHKCQGFGNTGTRGLQSEYLELLKGDKPVDRQNIFEGINTTWTRVKGGEKIKTILDKVQEDFNFRNPQLSVPALMEAYHLIAQLEDEFWRERKSKEITAIITQCLGLYMDAIASAHTAVPGETIKIDMEVVKRLAGNVVLKAIRLHPSGKDTMVMHRLNDNETYLQTYSLTLPKDAWYTNAYWLNEKGSMGMYKVDNPAWIGLPETPKQTGVDFVLEIEGKEIIFSRNVSYKFNSPEDGETYRPFEVTPEVFVGFAEKVYVFGDDSPRKVTVRVKAGAPGQKGTVRLPVSGGWKVNPASYDFDIPEKNATQDFTFEITAPNAAAELVVTPVAFANGKEYTQQLIEIKYDHILMQLVTQPAECKLAKVDLKKGGNNLAYIAGAGDEVATSLRQIGFKVTDLEVQNITTENLNGYDAIILGVRAYNVNEELKFKQKTLMDYVSQGGNLIVQYNTNNRLVVGNNLGPFPIKIGRERVTVESAPVRFLAPDHEVLNSPNKITDKDFEGWVQERGLYFASEWDAAYTAVRSCNDPGEDARDGGLLIAKHGDGNFIYTGYSWFRQLPSGVAGAFRLFANMVSLGNENRP